MINPELTAAVEKFAGTMSRVSDAELDAPWQWKGYDEGVRFTFFVTLIELRQLAVKLASERSAGIKLPPMTSAQHILAQYHSAFMDLQAALIGLPAKKATLPPGKKEWPVRTSVAHILGADIGFAAVIRYALENHRAGSWLPHPIPEKEYPRLYGLSKKKYDMLMNSTLPNLVAYHRKLHLKILREFADMTKDELALPAAYWEETRFHIGYRLHRFEAHLRQHTIQIDKTLASIGCGPSEARRLIRMLYSALADVNGLLILPVERKNQESIELARAIESRTKEMSKILS